MFSRFFIERPVFATVLSLLVILAGAVSIPNLPIEQYPEIAPPTVQVSTRYPGASAQTVVESVTAPIEQEINGVEGMLYMESLSSDDGSMSITVTFELGTDVDMAAVRIQNRIAIVEPTLPEAVRTQGVQVEKRSTSTLMFLNFYSPEGTYDDLLLSNFVTLRVKDVLARVPGVGAIGSVGAGEFAMRVWLDPDRLSARRLTVIDVIDALREQNVEVAAGRIGQAPLDDPSGFQISISAQGRLRNAEEFGQVVVNQTPGQEIVRLEDVARVELGARSYDTFARFNGVPSTTLSVAQLPGSNALEVSQGVRAALESLAESFPPDVAYTVGFDFTEFVSASIQEVVKTLLIAALLVFLTVLVFLGDWRATLVPAATIPVSLIGTFAVLLALGMSINLLTLFGLILAIGIVVDDAIVVVENVQRHVDEGMSPRQASIRSMEEVTGPIVATTIVLLAVFVPTLFLGGITGRLYAQFGLTVAVATVLSSFNALTLSPALCALLLRPGAGHSRFSVMFDKWLDRSRVGYLAVATWLVARRFVVIGLFAVLMTGGAFLYRVLPTGFLPVEDQSVFFVNVQLPDGAKLSRTNAVLEQLEAGLRELPGVKNLVVYGGTSFLVGANQPNVGLIVVVLDPWQDRDEPIEKTIERAAGPIFGQLDAIAFPFRPPPIRGIGQAGGIDLRVQDRTDLGVEALGQAAGDLVREANSDPALENVFTSFRAQVPQIDLEVDRERAKTMGVPISSIFETLRGSLGSSYVNDFNLLGRTYQVITQAEPSFRGDVRDIPRLQVRTERGSMVPLGSLVKANEVVGPPIIPRYNLYPSATIVGGPAPGHSTGEAAARMEVLLRDTLPAGMGYEWSGSTYQERLAGRKAPIAFGLALIVVFLVLAAQYESWTAPISILLTVPIGILGALLAGWLRGQEVNVYTQLGLVLLIALVAKNAILIVEFARQLRAEGRGRVESSLEAARLRFRPVLMTAMSFILGTLPLVIASGAGAASRQSLGTAVFGGMVLATVIGLLFVPAFDAMVAREPRDPEKGSTGDDEG